MHLMCCADRYDHHCGSPFDHFQTLCTIFWHAALELSHHLSCWSNGCELGCRKNNSPIKTESYNELLHEASFQCQWPCTSTYSMNKIWVTDIYTICCISPPIKSATSYLKIKHSTKMLYTREPYYWTCLVTGTLLEYIYTHWHYLQHLQYLPQNSVPFHPNTSKNINSTLQLHKFPATTQQHL